MGYYSSVIIACGEKAAQAIKTVCEEHSFMPTRVSKVVSPFGLITYMLQWTWVKWYGSFPEVRAIEDALGHISEMDSIEYAYKFIRVGEDNTTEENANEYGYDYFDDIYTECVVHIPKDFERAFKEEGEFPW